MYARPNMYMLFVRSDSRAMQVNEFNFNLCMHWNTHMDKIRREIGPYIVALRQMRPFTSNETSELIYTFIASRLVSAAPGKCTKSLTACSSEVPTSGAWMTYSNSVYSFMSTTHDSKQGGEMHFHSAIGRRRDTYHTRNTSGRERPTPKKWRFSIMPTPVQSPTGRTEAKNDQCPRSNYA